MPVLLVMSLSIVFAIVTSWVRGVSLWRIAVAILLTSVCGTIGAVPGMMFFFGFAMSILVGNQFSLGDYCGILLWMTIIFTTGFAIGSLPGMVLLGGPQRKPCVISCVTLFLAFGMVIMTALWLDPMYYFAAGVNWSLVLGPFFLSSVVTVSYTLTNSLQGQTPIRELGRESQHSR